MFVRNITSKEIDIMPPLFKDIVRDILELVWVCFVVGSHMHLRQKEIGEVRGRGRDKG